MIDARSFALLKVLNAECSGQGYKVFYIDDLKLSLPSEYAATAADIRETLKILCDREYISVKYEDDSEVCLKPLVKGRLAFENRIDGELEAARERKSYALYAFLGAAAGGAAATVIAVIAVLVAGGVC